MLRRLTATLSALVCACHTPNVPAIAKHALLDRGYHSIALGDLTLACFPEPGLQFRAADAHGRVVRGYVCCGTSEGEVFLDQPAP